jgi:hypothetical protein
VRVAEFKARLEGLRESLGVSAGSDAEAVR